MRKLFIIVVLAITSFATAQSDKKEKQTITIQDGITIPVTVKSYRAKLDLSLQEARYANPNSNESFEEMKEEVLQKLYQKGIKKSDIIEHKVDYYMSGRRNEGTTFELVSTDQKKITDFLSTAVPGASPRGVEYKLNYDESMVDKNMSTSMAKMKKRALTMAKELGFKTAKVDQVNISQSQSKEYREWISYKENGYISIIINYLLE